MPRRNDPVQQASAIELLRLSELKPPDRNARTHPAKQIRQIADSKTPKAHWILPVAITR